MRLRQLLRDLGRGDDPGGRGVPGQGCCSVSLPHITYYLLIPTDRRLSRGKRKGYCVRYRISGRCRKLTLGNVPLAEARKLCADAMFEIAQGRDPGPPRTIFRQPGRSIAPRPSGARAGSIEARSPPAWGQGWKRMAPDHFPVVVPRGGGRGRGLRRTLFISAGLWRRREQLGIWGGSNGALADLVAPRSR